jgi:mannitol/fructose-specific phosphotransferase system IIA component (Ntr-type)
VLLSELLSVGRVKVPLGSRTKNDVLQELVALIADGGDALNAAPILSAVRERELELTTGIGAGIAIPHGRTPLVSQLVVAAGVAATPIEYESLDGQPVSLFFLLVGPESASGAHVKVLSRISRLLRRDRLRRQLIAASSPEAFLDLVRSAEAA